MSNNMDYTYVVTRVDYDAKSMDVEFTAEGFDPVVVGVRLPAANENFDAVINSFAPYSVWNPQVIQYAEVSVGKSGSYIAPTHEQIEQNLQNLKMWEQIEFEKKVGDVLVKFNLMTSNPAKIPVSEL